MNDFREYVCKDYTPYLMHYGKGHDDSPPGRGSGRYPYNPKLHKNSQGSLPGNVMAKGLLEKGRVKRLSERDIRKLCSSFLSIISDEEMGFLRESYSNGEDYEDALDTVVDRLSKNFSKWDSKDISIETSNTYRSPKELCVFAINDYLKYGENKHKKKGTGRRYELP